MFASHGSFPARGPERCVRIALMKKSRIPSAITKEPTVDMKLYTSHVPPWEYVYTRRGIPSSPSRCCGKNVTFMPMNISQNVHLPRVSLSRRPNIFGHQ